MRRAILLTLLLVLVPVAAAHASAASVIRDCTDDGILEGRYTQKELRSAIANLPSDVDEYTNCRDIIRAAQLAGGTGTSSGGGTTGGGTAPGSTPDAKTGTSPGAFGGFSGFATDPTKGATKQEQAALVAASDDPVGAPATELASSVLPTPLVIALALGALGLLVLAALDLRRRVLARRGG